MEMNKRKIADKIFTKYSCLQYRPAPFGSKPNSDYRGVAATKFDRSSVLQARRSARRPGVRKLAGIEAESWGRLQVADRCQRSDDIRLFETKIRDDIFFRLRTFGFGFRRDERCRLLGNTITLFGELRRVGVGRFGSRFFVRLRVTG